MTPIGPFASKRRDYDFEMLSHEMAYGSLARPLSAPDRFLTTAAANSVAANDPDYDALFCSRRSRYHHRGAAAVGEVGRYVPGREALGRMGSYESII